MAPTHSTAASTFPRSRLVKQAVRLPSGPYLLAPSASDSCFSHVMKFWRWAPSLRENNAW